MSIVGHRHTGLVVEDMERVLAFYVRLGFQLERRDRERGEFISHLVGLEQIELESVKLRLQDGYRLELIRTVVPRSVLDGRGPDISRSGLHHLAFTVSDIDEAITTVLANGGSQISAPQTSDPGLPSIHAYVTDCERNVIHLAQNVYERRVGGPDGPQQHVEGRS